MSKTQQEQEAQPLKIKKPSFKRENDATFKLDLTKAKENTDAVPEQETKEPVLQTTENEEKQDVGLQEVGQVHTEEKPEITEIKEEVKEPIAETPVTQQQVDMPEGVNKLINFMKETGGTVQDYARLNVDLSKIDDDALLRQYYKSTKPHLDHDEVDFLLQDKYATLEDDDERSTKKKRLAFKEDIANAKNYFEQTKQKYYEDLKLRSSNVNSKAQEFFDRYNKEQEIAKQREGDFASKTQNFFNDEFKGFEISVGDKKFNYGIKNPANIAQEQSKTNTIFKKFLGNKGEITDLKGYHKAVYAANNIDSIAEHFYEQGKADATKNIIAQSNNINTDPRPQDEGNVYINGLRVKAISGVDSSRLKVKFKNKTKN